MSLTRYIVPITEDTQDGINRLPPPHAQSLPIISCSTVRQTSTKKLPTANAQHQVMPYLAMALIMVNHSDLPRPQGANHAPPETSAKIS